ncbi:V4R domain-containing protein [Chloroflexota bacterium]
MDRIIDQAWSSLLASVMKKRDILRPEMGDSIDLFLPQSRLLSFVESNPDFTGLLYSSAYSSARRNATSIVKKLGMPADYFWKFEYWPKARALTNLGQIVRKVFSSIMAAANEGNLEIMDLDVDPLRISISFDDCVECAGIMDLINPICFYHAGVFSGILSGLINRDLSSFETECCATGDDSCRFVIGDADNEYIKTGYNNYLSAPEIKTDMVSRLRKSLNNQSVRTLGNLVDVNYYQLVMANILLADPERFATANFKVGSQLGRELAAVLAEFYGHEGLRNMSEYYSQLGELITEVNGEEVQLKITISECAESIGPIKLLEMVSFLSGELQGLISKLTNTEVILKENQFNGEQLFLTFSPE